MRRCEQAPVPVLFEPNFCYDCKLLLSLLQVLDRSVLITVFSPCCSSNVSPAAQRDGILWNGVTPCGAQLENFSGRTQMRLIMCEYS